MAEIAKRRRDNNRLGFAYQLAFVRLVHRFPEQQPLEIVDELLLYVGIRLDIPAEAIEMYQQRQQTLAEHRLALLSQSPVHHLSAPRETPGHRWRHVNRRVGRRRR
jgi:hypothetical protein